MGVAVATFVGTGLGVGVSVQVGEDAAVGVCVEGGCDVAVGMADLGVGSTDVAKEPGQQAAKLRTVIASTTTFTMLLLLLPASHPHLIV